MKKENPNLSIHSLNTWIGIANKQFLRMALDSLPCNKKKIKEEKNPTVLINWRWRYGYKGRLEAIYFTSFDFDTMKVN